MPHNDVDDDGIDAAAATAMPATTTATAALQSPPPTPRGGSGARAAKTALAAVKNMQAGVARSSTSKTGGDNNDDDAATIRPNVAPPLRSSTIDSQVSQSGRISLKTATNTIIATQKLGGGARSVAAAQALTRLTGQVFDSDDQIPYVLRGPLVGVVTAGDSIASIVNANKPTVDALVGWEAFTGAIYLTCGVCWSYILGWMGFSFVWVFLIMVFLGNAFSRNLKAMRRRVEVETTRNLAIRRLETESETVEWLNKFVQRLWMQMEPSLSASLKASLEPSLASSNVSLPIFTLGSAAPRIETIRTIARTPDDVHIMDWDLNFTPVDEDDFSKREKELGDVRSSRIEVIAKVAGVPIPVVVANIEFRGKLRIGIKYMSQYPHVKFVEYSFLELPRVAFNLRPLKSFDLMDIGLSGIIDGVIASSLKSYCEPNKNIYDVEASFSGAPSDRPVGVLRITIYEATDLKNVELAGTSDPYAVIQIGGKEVARTSTIPTTLNPYWGETYDIPIMKSYLAPPSAPLPPHVPRPDDLRIQLFDKNDSIADKSMGVTSHLHLGRWIKLLNVKCDTAAVKKRKRPADSEAGPKSADAGDDIIDVRGPIEVDEVPLGRVEMDTLVTEWGTPFKDRSDIWRPLFREDHAHSGGAVVKDHNLGQVRCDLMYLPLHVDETEAAEEKIDVENLSSAERKKMEADAAQRKVEKEKRDKERIARELLLKQGVLTVTIHQAKELTCTKSASTMCVASISGVKHPPANPDGTFTTTPVARKTNNPIWDHTAVVYVEDTDVAEVRLVVRDSAGGRIGSAQVPVKDVINRADAQSVPDWFKLHASHGAHGGHSSNVSGGLAVGKVRVTFKWAALDLENAHDEDAIIRKEPIAMLKLKVVEAKRVANVEAFRKSDPYATISLSRHRIGATHVKENTLDPVWNEIFYAVVYSRRQLLRFELFDYNKVKKDISLGQVEFYLDEILEYDNFGLPRSTMGSRAALSSGAMTPDAEVLGEDSESSRAELLNQALRSVSESVDSETVDLADDEERDLVREQWLRRNRSDGFQVTTVDVIRDVWAPIYLRPSDEKVDEDGEVVKKSKTLGAPPLLAQSTTGALNLVGLGPGKIGQHGHLHFELEYLAAHTDKIIRPMKPERLHEELRRVTSQQSLKDLKDAEVPTSEEAVQMPKDIVAEYPAGVLRLSLHEARGINTGMYYMDFVIDDEVVRSTRVQRRTNNPVWEVTSDVFVKHMLRQKFRIVLRECREGMGSVNDLAGGGGAGGSTGKKADKDPVVGFWEGAIGDFVGVLNCWLPLRTESKAVSAEARISVGYSPMMMAADEDGSKNTGTLYVDIVDAVHLEAVDSSGTSDPYCVVTLNDSQLHRTKVHKKQLNPVFNETVTATIRSRLRSTLTVTVRDHNSIGKHTILGTASIQLSDVRPEELTYATLTLQGARSGVLRLRFYFDPHKLQDKSEVKGGGGGVDAEASRIDKREDSSLSKLAKGVGGGLLGSMEQLVGKNDVRQEQGGVTAEQFGASKKAPVRMFGASKDAKELSTPVVPFGVEGPNPLLGSSQTDGRESPLMSRQSSVMFHSLMELQEKSTLCGTVTLNILAARGLKPVDDGGTSDPYVKVTQLVHGKVKTLLKTRTIKKTLDPVWTNETVHFQVPPSLIRIIVRDKNTFSESKPLGEVEVDLGQVLKSADSFDKWLTLGLGGTGEVHVTCSVDRTTSGVGGSRASPLQSSASVESLSLSRLTSRQSLIVPNNYVAEILEPGSGRLSPSAQSLSNLSETGSVDSVAATTSGQERKRFFGFGKKK